MQQSEITRIALHKDAPELVDDALLADMPDVRREASELLGYEAKPAAAGGVAEDNELLAALRRCEIEILDWQDVEQYMLEKQHATERAAMQARHAKGDQQQNSWREYQWHETALGDYKGFVPDYVLNKALTLKRELPDVRFGVVELTETKDPFLVASISGEYAWDRTAYYIEVWDEASFAGERR